MSRGSYVLLVEDDPALGAQLVTQLERAGFQPVWWKRGRALDPGSLTEVELVILDLMLPGLSGFEMLEQLRGHSDVPVLVLSARNDTDDKVRALRLGADDYLTKPFWPEELVERARARLRRPVLDRGELLEFGSLRIDRARREVSVEGTLVPLTRVEFDFLTTLAERPGAAVTRRVLAEQVLDPERDGNERTLDVHASRLRKKLGGSFVQTVWGIGYRLEIGRDP